MGLQWKLDRMWEDQQGCNSEESPGGPVNAQSLSLDLKCLPRQQVCGRPRSCLSNMLLPPWTRLSDTSVGSVGGRLVNGWILRDMQLVHFEKAGRLS